MKTFRIFVGLLVVVSLPIAAQTPRITRKERMNFGKNEVSRKFYLVNLLQLK